MLVGASCAGSGEVGSGAPGGRTATFSDDQALPGPRSVALRNGPCGPTVTHVGALVWVSLTVWLVLTAVVAVWAMRSRRQDRNAARRSAETSVDLREAPDRVQDT